MSNGNGNGMAADHATIIKLIQAYKAAGAAGRGNEADQLLTRAAQMAPEHPAVLNELGLRMLERGEAAKARDLFERATQSDSGHPSLWSNLAASLKALGQEQAELQAVERALALDPRHLSALLQKGALLTRQGKPRTAAGYYQMALGNIPPGAQVPTALRSALESAAAAVRANNDGLAEFLSEQLGTVRSQHSAEAHERFDHCLDTLVGRRRVYLPQPTFMYFPHLPAYEFYPRDLFPWLADLESASAQICAEFQRVFMEDQDRLEPYISLPGGAPVDQWKELNNSRRWSAFYLWREGKAFPEHLSRCPRTVAALEMTPRVEIPAHGPSAFFSILDGKSHIPPHTGASNTRLTVHLPLVLPGNCSFRVGTERREWQAGQAWVFDDTVEHEAWNESDAPRAILIFDIWNPYLTAAERSLVSAATVAVEEYYGGQTLWQGRN